MRFATMSLPESLHDWSSLSIMTQVTDVLQPNRADSPATTGYCFSQVLRLCYGSSVPWEDKLFDISCRQHVFVLNTSMVAGYTEFNMHQIAGK